MGLDICFFKAKKSSYAQWKEEDASWREQVKQVRDNENLTSEEKDKKVTELQKVRPELDYTVVASFRMVNFLLPFFGYEDNCSDVVISTEELAHLIDVCGTVLDDHTLADQLLPTESGFFFGNTNYDSVYFADVRCVKETLSKVEIKEDESLFMNCWW